MIDSRTSGIQKPNYYGKLSWALFVILKINLFARNCGNFTRGKNGHSHIHNSKVFFTVKKSFYSPENYRVFD